ncbi:MAG: helix-turn-helix transcriptional regulator [Candidatus Thermoplasmatota archaeon]|nr:helix-turn-helix transcriptional regulator [Candidatus Thermoplasmatota archaeon]
MEETSSLGSMGAVARCPLVKEAGDLCPHVLQGVVGSVGRSWTILILVTLGNFGKLRFHELQSKLGRISPKTLSSRLKEMGSAGFIRRESYAEVPPRVDYSLTVEGRDLVEALRPLIRWADRTGHLR